MQCSCSVSSGYDEESGYWLTQKRKAAKPHKCYECRNEIVKGEIYTYSTVIYDGTVDNFKTCGICEDIINHFFGSGHTCGYVISELKEYLREYWQEDLPSSCISKLTPAARDYVCDYLQQFQEADQCQA